MLAQLSQDTLAVSGAGAARSRRPILSSPATHKRGRTRATGCAGGGGGDGADAAGADLAPRVLFVRVEEGHHAQAHPAHRAGSDDPDSDHDDGEDSDGGGGGALAGAHLAAAAPGDGVGGGGRGGVAHGYDSDNDDVDDDLSFDEDSDGGGGGGGAPAAAPAAAQLPAAAPAAGAAALVCALCTLKWDRDEGDEAFYDGAHFLRVECSKCHLSFHASCLGWEAPGTFGRDAVVTNLTQRRTGRTCVIGRDGIECNRCCWQRDHGAPSPPVPDNFWSTTGAGRAERAMLQGRCLGLPLPPPGDPDPRAQRAFVDRVKKHIDFITEHHPWLLERLAVPPTPPFLPGEQLEPARAELVAREHRAFEVSQYLFVMHTCRCCGEKRPVHMHPDRERVGNGHLSTTYRVNAVECIRAGCGCRPRIYKTEGDYRAHHAGVNDLPPPAAGIVVCARCWQSTKAAQDGKRGQPFSALNGHGPMPPPHPAIAALTHADALAIRVVVPFLQIQRLKYDAGLRASGNATTMLRRSKLHLHLPLTPEECATVALHYNRRGGGTGSYEFNRDRFMAALLHLVGVRCGMWARATVYPERVNRWPPSGNLAALVALRETAEVEVGAFLGVRLASDRPRVIVVRVTAIRRGVGDDDADSLDIVRHSWGAAAPTWTLTVPPHEGRAAQVRQGPTAVAEQVTWFVTDDPASNGGAAVGEGNDNGDGDGAGNGNGNRVGDGNGDGARAGGEGAVPMADHGGGNDADDVDDSVRGGPAPDALFEHEEVFEGTIPTAEASATAALPAQVRAAVAGAADRARRVVQQGGGNGGDDLSFDEGNDGDGGRANGSGGGGGGGGPNGGVLHNDDVFEFTEYVDMLTTPGAWSAAFPTLFYPVEIDGRWVTWGDFQSEARTDAQYTFAEWADHCMWRSDGKPQAHPTFPLLAQTIYTTQRLREQLSFFVMRPRGADGMTAQQLVDILDDPDSIECKAFVGSLLAGTSHACYGHIAPRLRRP